MLPRARVETTSIEVEDLQWGRLGYVKGVFSGIWSL